MSCLLGWLLFCLLWLRISGTDENEIEDIKGGKSKLEIKYCNKRAHFLPPGKCYGQYGCFKKAEFFDPVTIVLISLPTLPEHINVTYSLFTSKNMLHPVEVKYNDDLEVLQSTVFNPEWPVVFIIHGWITMFKLNEWSGVS